jgi:hypothetical protein
MPDRPAPGRRPPGAGPAFDERLSVPWWWWPFGFGVAALLAAEVHLGYPGVRAWLPYLVTVPLAIAVLIRTGRHRVQVSGGELRVGPAHIDLRHLGRARMIQPAGKRRALGPDLDPAAFLLHRPWVGSLVRVELTDPQDPTPYWIFSVRRAAELTALLQSGTGSAAQGDTGKRSPGR